MIWDTARWTTQVKPGFTSAAFSKDGKVLALGGSNIELIDPASWKPIGSIELPRLTMRELGHGPPPAGRSARSEHLADEEQYLDKKIPISVIDLAFSPDGGTLAAGCQDGTVRLVKMNQ